VLLRYHPTTYQPFTFRTRVDKQISIEFESRFPELAAELGPESLARLVDASTVVDLPARRKLFRDRMPVDAIYLLLEGEMVATIEDGGKTLEVGRIRPGDWLGEVAVLTGEMIASSTVSTITKCRVLKMHAQDFDRLVLKDEEISHVLLGQLVELLALRLRESNASAAKMSILT
jgi:CRP-like cAMP-binding protein